MISGDTIIPDHKIVSSEWEKNELIREAYGFARLAIIPRLISLLDKHVTDGIWIASTDIFADAAPLELWNKPDYAVIHRDAWSTNETSDYDTLIHGTTTQIFLEKQENCRSSVEGKLKLRKGQSDKCLLRHEFSAGCHWFMVCKLRRRHQKEISKLSSVSAPLVVLDRLARSAVLKYYKAPEKHKTSTKDKESGKANVCNDTMEKTKPKIFDDSNVSDDVARDLHQTYQLGKEESVLQKEAKCIVNDALSIVRAAENLEVGLVPRTSTVRWKAEEEFEMYYS